MHSLNGIIAMNEHAAQQTPRKGPKTAEEWDLGLTILESLVCINDMQGECISRECIAEVMDISAQAVENLEIRAFKKLRRLTSHLRPELEDLGVVQRLQVGGLGKAKGRANPRPSVGSSGGEYSPAPDVESKSLHPAKLKRHAAPVVVGRVVGSFSTL